MAEGIWEKSPGVSRSKDLMASASQNDFDTFWSQYPRKVGKFDAMRAYGKARSLASAAEILDGLKNFCAHLPEEVRFIAHPASWLNSGRWMDEYDAPKAKPTATDWWEECKEVHGGKCEKRWQHDTLMMEARAKLG